MTEAFIIGGYCLLLGSVIGVFAGLLGIGGGLLMVPASLYLFDTYLNIPVSQHMPTAIATSLASIIITSASSARAHYLKGNLISDHLKILAVSVVLGSLVGAVAVTRIDGQTLQIMFAVLICGVALQMAFYRPKSSSLRVTTPRLAGIGTTVGGLAALLGVGGGAFMVPMLTWLNVNIKHAIATASFCGSLVAVAATVIFMLSGQNLSERPEFSIGYIYLPAVLGVVLTSSLTTRIGASLVQKLPVHTLKKIFAVFLLCVSIRMLAPLYM